MLFDACHIQRQIPELVIKRKTLLFTLLLLYDIALQFFLILCIYFVVWHNCITFYEDHITSVTLVADENINQIVMFIMPNHFHCS